MRTYTVQLAQALGVVGLINVQYAMKDNVVYVLEVNPRASRTIPFVSKANGIPWAQIATQVVAGHAEPADAKAGLHELVQRWQPDTPYDEQLMYHVKEVVLPWARFPGVDTLLGPEMRSTGEAMGSGATFGEAFAKALLGCRHKLPTSGTVYLSVNDNDKPNLIPIARELAGLGFRLLASSGTAAALEAAGLEVQSIYKVNEGRPNTVDYIKNGEIDLIFNTTLGKASFFDEKAIRKASLLHGVTTITTLSSAAAAVQAIHAMRNGGWTVQSLQERT
jgi:carbamoyl-phosphate synthase large subunit